MFTLQTIEFVLLLVPDLLSDFHIIECTFLIARFLYGAGQLCHEPSQALGLLDCLRLEAAVQALNWLQ